MTASSPLRSVLVTGSSSGIGWAIAGQFIRAGYRVFFHGIESEDEITPKIRELPARAETLYAQADISDPDACRALIQKAHDAWESLDVIVNNAGIQFTADIIEFPQAKWQKILDINLSAAFYLTQAALPMMRARGFGRLIHIASAHGLVASPHKAAYVAAKHGIVGFSKVVALENAGKGITSNAVCPGWVDTPLVRKQIADNAEHEGISIEDATRNLLLEKHPAPQFVHAEDLGALSVFLASDAARSITGTAIPMDEGWTAR